jgi:hypothetical protein
VYDELNHNFELGESDDEIEEEDELMNRCKVAFKTV